MWPGLRHWLWEGSFEPESEKLELLDPEQLSGEDFLTVSSRTLGEIWHLVEELQEAERQRRGRDFPGRRDEAHDDEEETKRIAKSMLPTMDALDRIIEYGEDFPREDEAFANWLNSVKALRTRLLKTLESFGLQQISAVGSEVDLEKHDVVGVVPAGEFPANTVVSEQQKGYYFRGKLLRDAKVIVAQ